MHVQYQIKGRVAVVLVADQAGSLVSARREEIEATFAGFSGDKHSGLTCLSGGRTPFYPRGTEIRNYRQISIVSGEEMAQVAAAMNITEIKPEWLGANLMLSGINHLTQLPPFTRLFFEGGAVLLVQRDNEPCMWPGKILAGEYGHPELEKLFITHAKARRGLTACVERPGVIRSGEGVCADTPVQVIYSPEA